MNVLTLLLADSRFPGGGHVHSGGLEEAAARGLVRTEEDLPPFLRNRLRTAGALAATFAAAAAHRGATGTANWSTMDEELDARTPSAAQRAASRAQGKATARAAKMMLVAESSNSAGTALPARPDMAADPPASWADQGRPVWNPVAAGDSLGSRADQGRPARNPIAAADSPAPWVDQARRARNPIATLLSTTPRPHHPVILGAIVGAGGGSPIDAALAAAYLAISGPASASVRLLGLDPLRVNGIVAALASEVAAVAEEAAAVAHLDPAELPAPGSPGFDLLAEEHDRHHREEVRLFVS